MCMIVMPLIDSLCKMADCMGDAPRYAGRSDPCTFMGHRCEHASVVAGIILPYARTTRKSALRDLSR